MLIGAEDVQTILESVGSDVLMDEIMEALEVAFRDYDPLAMKSPARQGFAYEQPRAGLLEWMPVYDGSADSVTVKMVGYHPSNPRRLRIPTILSTVSVYDTTTGHLRAIADGTLLTAMRTGATSGVATSVLAKPDSSVVGLIGLGAQAVTQLHAICQRFQVETVLAYDSSESQMQTLESRVAGFRPSSMEIIPSDVANIVQSSDILCTSTSIEVGNGPLFDDIECRPWLHVNAIGSDFPGKAEIPLGLLERSFVVADFLPQAFVEGECQRLMEDQVAADLPTIFKDPEIAADARDRTSVFDSTGWALTDHVAMGVLMSHALALNAYTELPLEAADGDPYSPYET